MWLHVLLCKWNVVVEDSDCDETGEMLLSRLQQCPRRSAAAALAADDADITDNMTQEFLAAIETEFSSTSTHCSIESIKKASFADA